MSTKGLDLITELRAMRETNAFTAEEHAELTAAAGDAFSDMLGIPRESSPFAKIHNEAEEGCGPCHGDCKLTRKEQLANNFSSCRDELTAAELEALLAKLRVIKAENERYMTRCQP